MSEANERKQPLILVVDDTAMIRDMARESLEAAGLDVVAAADGGPGLRTFQERAPDLVLLDVQMPGLDGFSVCEQIRQRLGDTDTPILMMTGADDEDSIRRAYDAGATDFVTKPVNWQILTHRIRYMLRMSQVLVDLRSSQVRLANAQRIARLGDWEFDLATGELVCSDELRHLYGLTRESALDKVTLLSLIHPDDREIVRSAVDRALSEGSTLSVDHRLAASAGAERSVHLHADVVFDDDGEPIKLAGTAQDVTERKVAEAEIRFLAYHDSLTRLGNRRLFRERLGYALAQARRNQTIVGVMFLDLDNFKRINDTLGHSAGDELLKEVAERLTRSVRETDCVSRSLEDESALTVSRFGGDEFMISLCSVRAPEEIGLVASRVSQALAVPFNLKGQDVVVTASLGVAVAPADGEYVDELLRNADAAMYKAKQRVPGSYLFYERSMNGSDQKNLTLENDLRKAIAQGQLSLNYQPKVALATGKITGFEALVRWQHPLLGAIPPSDFIPLAEQAGLIIGLGEFVLRSVCSQVNVWRESGLPPLRISVNLSAHHFRTEEIARTVTDILEEADVSPRLLDIEITESTMMENKQIAVAVLQRLKGVGITVSLDDFGTGYSSLSYLKGFPIDTVKIDRSFVCELESDPDYAAITAAIISMAKTLNLRTVAEGVETEGQLAFLRANGCDEMQGYLFSRPLSVADATQLQQDLVNGSSSCRLPQDDT